MTYDFSGAGDRAANIAAADAYNASVAAMEEARLREAEEDVSDDWWLPEDDEDYWEEDCDD